MSFNIYTTDFFSRQLKRLSKKHPSLKSDFVILTNSLKKKPLQGQYLGRDCYKIRMTISSKGKGKRSGSRVITCVKVIAGSVYLLSVYDKGQKENISEKELDTLLKLAGL